MSYSVLNEVMEEMELIFQHKKKEMEMAEKDFSKDANACFYTQSQSQLLPTLTFEVMIAMDEVLEDLLEFNHDQLRAPAAPKTLKDFVVDDDGWGWYIDLDVYDNSKPVYGGIFCGGICGLNVIEEGNEECYEDDDDDEECYEKIVEFRPLPMPTKEEFLVMNMV